MPTAAQVYLAADLFTALPNDKEDGMSQQLRALCGKTLADGLKEEGWTGKTATCSEYGKPPTMADPEAQDAVLKLRALQLALAEYYHAQLGDEAQSVLANVQKAIS